MVTVISPLSSPTTLFCHIWFFVSMNIAFDKDSLHPQFQYPAQGHQGFQVVFQSSAKNMLSTPQEDPPFMWQVQRVFAQFRGRSSKKWVDLKAVFPQRGHHNLQPFLRRAQATTGSTFLIRLMHLILRFLPPPICFPQFPCQPSSCLSTSVWKEVGREDTS